MSDVALLQLAKFAGLATEWEDFRGHSHRTSPQTLRTLLASLDLPADSPTQVVDSLARLEAETADTDLPPLITAEIGLPISLPGTLTPAASLRLELETGEVLDRRVQTDGAGRHWLPPVAIPGYHRLLADDTAITVAVAPPRCFGIEDLADAGARGNRRWGLTAQIYSLRSTGDGGIGNFSGLSAFARSAAAHGADTVAISPVHALFSADTRHFSPYAPSSRLFLNALHADPAAVFGEDQMRQLSAAHALEHAYARLEADALIDWPAAAGAKQALLRRVYEVFAPQLGAGETALARDFQQFVIAGGERLIEHARFEALHADRLRADPKQWHWHTWPAALRNPQSREVSAFASEHAREVDYHLFLQWLADHGLHAAQAAARGAGMSIGLIADLAVGTDSGGSYAWSRQHDLLAKVTVGAPPDLLNLQGQNWGLTALSPRALKQSAYAPFLEMLRANLHRVGGLRIDHVLGLRRLWIVPDGADAGEGAYLNLPLDDLLRLVALESWRHRAIVVGEDLGTVPQGFQDRLARSGVLGMRVLWFERDHGFFIDPQRWSARAMATTTTHDLPTIAGWWGGRDIDWRAELDLFPADGDEDAERIGRSADRDALWAAFRHAGVARNEAMPEQSGPVVDAAIAFVARTPAPLVIVPVEDALGLTEQPNLPGTTTGHPNWRRRLPGEAELLLETPTVLRRLESLRRERGGA